VHSGVSTAVLRRTFALSCAAWSGMISAHAWLANMLVSAALCCQPVLHRACDIRAREIGGAHHGPGVLRAVALVASTGSPMVIYNVLSGSRAMPFGMEQRRLGCV
jgi:hypothetical protein